MYKAPFRAVYNLYKLYSRGYKWLCYAAFNAGICTLFMLRYHTCTNCILKGKSRVACFWCCTSVQLLGSKPVAICNLVAAVPTNGSVTRRLIHAFATSYGSWITRLQLQYLSEITWLVSMPLCLTVEQITVSGSRNTQSHASALHHLSPLKRAFSSSLCL